MKVLIVAYYFPPESSSGSFRPLYFANNLIRYGWQVSVLTCSNQYYLDTQPVDEALLSTLNNEVEVVRSRVIRPREALISLKNKLLQAAFNEESKATGSSELMTIDARKVSMLQKSKDFITDFLALPDPHIGWLPCALWDGIKLIRSQKADVLFATGSPWTCFLVGALLKKITGKPLVLDYRDPWGENSNMRLKNRYIGALEMKIEKTVVASSDLIIANTRELHDNFYSRFPFLRKNHVVTLPNGFERFIESPACKNNALTLTHAGALYLSRNPVNLLKAVVELSNEGAISSGSIIIKFVGGISINDPILSALLESCELEKVVEIYPRMPLTNAIEHQLSSDVLFLLQPDFPLQIPRKLYDYISLRKPILAITNRKGATARIIEENHFGTVVPDTVADLKHALKKLWLSWISGTLAQPSTEKSELFLNSNISKMLHDNLMALTDRNSKNVKY